jgi:deoxyribodipyrimidine photo-lyase
MQRLDYSIALCRIGARPFFFKNFMPNVFQSGLVWFRRDLRLYDNAALSAALQQCEQMHCVFVFDTEILDALPRADRRVEFIRESLVEVDAALCALSGKTSTGLIVLHGAAAEEIPALAESLQVQAVFCAHDYEPQAVVRDEAVRSALETMGRQLVPVKDHVIFEAHEVLTQMGKPYSVFTPYMRAWLAKLGETPLPEHEIPSAASALASRPQQFDKPVPTLSELGFERTNLAQLGIPTGMSGADKLLEDFMPRMERYHETRDFPAMKGPSYLSVHLRFGTVSIRRLVNLAMQEHVRGSAGSKTWLGELVWRDFYFQVLANFPRVASGSFKPEYNAIAWETGESGQALLDAWCEGRTGYPLVDAAMLQLNQTGYMHNRLRMVAGSFLCKHLGLDWRWGERYFAEKLNDFDLAANNGGWQWVSSSGCDAQPYFRIFNPVSQSEKFDSQGKFIRRYIPALDRLSDKAVHAPWMAKPIELESAGLVLGRDYPLPIVDHTAAREKTLQRYGVLRKTA